MRSQPRLGQISHDRDKISRINTPARAGCQNTNSNTCVLWSNLTLKPNLASPGRIFSYKHGIKTSRLAKVVPARVHIKQALRYTILRSKIFIIDLAVLNRKQKSKVNYNEERTENIPHSFLTQAFSHDVVLSRGFATPLSQIVSLCVTLADFFNPVHAPLLPTQHFSLTQTACRITVEHGADETTY